MSAMGCATANQVIRKTRHHIEEFGSYMTLPIHPQPLDNESMTSWLKRLAEGNGSSISNILSSYIDSNKRWDRKDSRPHK